ncbi:MAG TPA: dynamin family protein [Azospirillaceae bacterium]|nr:dynamin family protein [Azospirillaceae bacterium]
MTTPRKALLRRLETLEAHLKAEHPTLLPVVPTFRRFDKVLYRMGLLPRDQSLATRIPWWPMISVLGIFSAGKSSFINRYLGVPLQSSGNQAVDDKFTVICYGSDDRVDALPGTALNADPRFPFYRISDEIEKVAAGEGKRIDSYLQLKTCTSPKVKGKIIIDSPGFDADDQRRSILRLTDHIIDLSDLVLIFFDARRPEPGAMHDTLGHLVAKSVPRADSRKFIYILNQIDSTAKEDNPEAVVGAWQRAIAQAGLVSGKFYGIYNKELAAPFENEAQRARYEAKCDADLAEIEGRMAEVEIGRGYRIVGMVETLVNELEGEVVPFVRDAVLKWRRQVMTGDVIGLGVLAALLVALVFAAGFEATGAFLSWATGTPENLLAVLAGLVVAAGGAHFWLRGFLARRIAKTLPERFGQMELDTRGAFLTNTTFFRSLFGATPAGWGRGAKKQVFAIRESAAKHIQMLNDLYTDPTGKKVKTVEKEPAKA